MTLVQQARDFLTKFKDFAYSVYIKEYQALPQEVQEEVTRLKTADRRSAMDKLFVQENAQVDKRHEEESPSGKYRLVITPYTTGEKTWRYSQGLVFRKGQDTPLFEVRRNYGSFPFLWVEDHPTGHSFLVCGEDYQGQSVLELDTGRRKDFLPKEASAGHGFCWAEYRFDSKANILVVNGCYWACPYEYKFFDFSNPMESGWPAIELDGYLDDSHADVWPELSEDGTLTHKELWEDDYSDEDPPPRELASIKTFKREGLKFILVHEWVSDTEELRRAERDESKRAHEAKVAKFRKEDPLYLAYLEQLNDPVWSSRSSYESTGVTYSGWCPDFKQSEHRWCRRILNRKQDERGHTVKQGYTVDLEWAITTGPIKMIVNKDGQAHATKFFEHSSEGMRSAFAWAKQVVS